MPQGKPVEIGESTHLVPVFDPVLSTFRLELRRNNEPTRVHGLAERFGTVDEAMDTVDAFLAAAGVPPLTRRENLSVGRELIMVMGGHDAALLTFAEQGLDAFLLSASR